MTTSSEAAAAAHSRLHVTMDLISRICDKTGVQMAELILDLIDLAKNGHVSGCGSTASSLLQAFR